MKKAKKRHMKRKTKAIIGIILCIVLAAANTALSNRTWTRDAAMEDLMDYHSTCEVDIVTELPKLLIKNKGHHRFYLVENEKCFAQFSINSSFWFGWGDGPCLIVEKDSAQPIQLVFNSFMSAGDTDKQMLRIFGIIRDDDIERLEIEVRFACAGEVTTMDKLNLYADSFIEYGVDRYVNIDHVYVSGLGDYLETPLNVRGFNSTGEMIYNGAIQFGQSTSFG